MWIQAYSTLCLGCPAHMELYCAIFVLMLLLLQSRRSVAIINVLQCVHPARQFLCNRY